MNIFKNMHVKSFKHKDNPMTNHKIPDCRQTNDTRSVVKLALLVPNLIPTESKKNNQRKQKQ